MFVPNLISNSISEIINAFIKLQTKRLVDIEAFSDICFVETLFILVFWNIARHHDSPCITLTDKQSVYNKL